MEIYCATEYAQESCCRSTTQNENSRHPPKTCLLNGVSQGDFATLPRNIPCETPLSRRQLVTHSGSSWSLGQIRMIEHNCGALFKSTNQGVWRDGSSDFSSSSGITVPRWTGAWVFGAFTEPETISKVAELRNSFQKFVYYLPGYH